MSEKERKPRSIFGRSLNWRMKATRELEAYEGGCFYGPGIIICHNPEYGYEMYGLELDRERVRTHEDTEVEQGCRVGAWMEIADDATLGLWHAEKNGRFLASLHDCPSDGKVRR